MMRYILVALVIIATTLYVFNISDNCTDFYMLGYSGKGELIKARICKVVENGVYVQPEVTGTKLAESLYVAYKAFDKRHGPLNYGFILEIKGPYTYIDGRSADIAIYSAMYSLISGKKTPLATGSIDNDLYTVNGVAYVREKLSAVAGGPVIIPYANRTDIYGDVPVIPVRNLDELDGVLSSLPS